eukprot:gene42655-biopygen74688
MPMPSPLSWAAHGLPSSLHAFVQRASIDGAEWAFPWGFIVSIPLELIPHPRLAPRRAADWLRRAAAFSTLALMAGIQATGGRGQR